MKVLIYVNTLKNNNAEHLKSLTAIFKSKKIDYKVVEDDTFTNENFDALFVIGGDGTILRCTEFANTNKIPIVGINGGNFGFLTEFEPFEIEEAVNLFIDGKLSKDYRSTIVSRINGKNHYALNDIVMQRCYFNQDGLVISAGVYISGTKINSIIGDGVIISTPTGSTAYSLSAGGAFLSPDINAFSITPLAAHSLSQRPIIYPADKSCEIILLKGEKAGIFVDGKFVSDVYNGENIIVKKAENSTVFLRRDTFNFFKRLYDKLNNKNEE